MNLGLNEEVLKRQESDRISKETLESRTIITVLYCTVCYHQDIEVGTLHSIVSYHGKPISQLQ